MDDMLEKILDLMGPKKGSGKELADYLGVSGNVVTNWKNGSSKSYQRYVKQIAKFYGVSPEYLLGEEKAPEKNELPATNEELDKALEGVNFALYGEAKDLTVKEKQDVLKFIQFLKSKRGE